MTNNKTANVYKVVNYQTFKYGNWVGSDIKVYLSHIMHHEEAS